MKRTFNAFIHFYHSLFRNDIFLTYSRVDGKRYTSALAAILSSKGYLPLMDSIEPRLGKATPHELLMQLRLCPQLVVIASGSALNSHEVTKEVRIFPRWRRSVVVIQFELPVLQARWARLLPGISPEQEAPQQLIEGQPSKQIVELIINAYKYRKQRVRQRALAAVTATFLLGSALVATGFGWKSRHLATQVSGLSGNVAALQRQQGILTTQLGKTQAELTQANENVIAKQAESKRAQNNAEQATKLASARRKASEIDQARKISGYTSAKHLQTALDVADELNRQHLTSEASSLLADSFATSPRFMRTFPVKASSKRGAAPAAPLPESHTFLVADDAMVYQYDYISGREITPRLEHEGTVKEISPASKGNLVLVKSEGLSGSFYYVWDMKQRKQLIAPARCSGPARFSRSGRWFAKACGNAEITVTDTSESFSMKSDGEVSSLAFSEDDTALFAIEGNRVILHDLKTKVRQAISTDCEVSPNDSTQVIELSPNGKYVITWPSPSYDVLNPSQRILRVCSISSTSRERTPALRVQFRSSFYVKISPDGERLMTYEDANPDAGGQAERVRLFLTSDLTISATLANFFAFDSAISPDDQLAFSPDSRFIFSDSVADGTIVADSDSGRYVCVVPHDLTIRSTVGIAGDGKYLLTIVNRSSRELRLLAPGSPMAQVWECQSGSVLGGLAYKGVLSDALFSAGDSRLFLISHHPYTSESPKLQGRLFALPGGIHMLDEDDAQEILYLTIDDKGNPASIREKNGVRSIQVDDWNNHTHQTLPLPENTLGIVRCETTSGNWLAYHFDPRQEILTELAVAPHSRSTTYKLPFVPKGALRQRYFFYNGVDGPWWDSQRHVILSDPGRSILDKIAPEDIADRGNGLYRVVGRDAGVRDIKSGKVSKDMLQGKGRGCEKAALDDRGDVVALAGDGKVQVFQLPAGTLLAERSYEGNLDGVVFSRTGRWIGIASGGEMRLWAWRFDDLLNAGQSLLNANRQTDAWKQTEGR